MPQRDENNFFLVCLETAILPRIMISSSRPLVTADPSSHHCHLQTSLTPGTRQGSLWPHLVMKNQNCQPELLHMQWQCTGSLMGTSCHVCKTAGTGCSSQVFTAPPTKSTSTCLSDDRQPRSNTFTPNPFHRWCWWALSDTVRLDFLLLDSIARGGMEQHTVSIVSELKYIIFQLRSQKQASHFLERHGSRGGPKRC